MTKVQSLFLIQKFRSFNTSTMEKESGYLHRKMDEENDEKQVVVIELKRINRGGERAEDVILKEVLVDKVMAIT